MKLITLIIALSVVGCTDITPPHWTEVCTETNIVMTPMPSAAAPGMGIPMGASIRMVPINKCIKTEPKCVWGRDYTGSTNCEEA